MLWILTVLALVSASTNVRLAESNPAAYEAGVIELMNQQRAHAGLPPLGEAPELDAAAEDYSTVLGGGTCFEHTCGPVPQLPDRLGQAGYVGWQGIGENIAAGYPTPDAVVAGWMASPEHRANILSLDFSEVGVGFTAGGGKYGTYWAADFGTRAQH